MLGKSVGSSFISTLWMQIERENHPTHLVQQLWNVILVISYEISYKITNDHKIILSLV